MTMTALKRPPRYLAHDPMRELVQARLRNEIELLEERIRRLLSSSSPTRDDMLQTYRRVLAQKQAFMRHWRLSDAVTDGITAKL